MYKVTSAIKYKENIFIIHDIIKEKFNTVVLDNSRF